MVLGLFAENSPISILVLATDLLLMIVAVGYRRKIKRHHAVTLSYIAASIATLTVTSSLIEYSLDHIHILGHSLFSLILVFCAILYVPNGVPPLLNRLVFFDLQTFDRFQYLLTEIIESFFIKLHRSLELNTFDRSQYVLANLITTFSAYFKKIQSGNLSLNMLYFLLGLIFCFLLHSLSI